MAKCPACLGTRTVLDPETGYPMFCHYCGGSGEDSCCDGPSGCSTEVPTTPSEKPANQGK